MEHKTEKRKRKEVPITIRISRRLFDFYEAYSAKYGVTKKSVLENKIIEKFEQIKTQGFLNLFSVGLSIEELKKKVSREDVKKATKGDEKFVIFIDPCLDEFVQRLSYTLMLKPTDIYRLLLTEFYAENRHKLSEEDLKDTRTSIAEEIRKILES